MLENTCIQNHENEAYFFNVIHILIQGQSLNSRKSPKISLMCLRECSFKMSYGLRPNVCLFSNGILKHI